MSVKKYENISLFPLEFVNRQMVEAGETFERDFEESEEGSRHEKWLKDVGIIRDVVDIPRPVSMPTQTTKSDTAKTDNIKSDTKE